MLDKKLFMFHIDLKRAQWTPAYLYKTVQLIKSWGYNSILYEIEDKFIFNRHPSIAHVEAPPRISTGNFVKICKSLSVEVIPMMQSLGHAECIVSKPEFAHFRERVDCLNQYDPMSIEARTFICDLFDEIIDVFKPSEYFHIGGDEVFSLGTSQSGQAIVKKIGLGGLYLKHILPILEHIHNRGLRPIIWADMIASYPEIIHNIPKYAVLMDWDYGISQERGHELHVHAGGPLDLKTGHRETIWGLTWESFQNYDNPAFRNHLEKYAVDKQTTQDGTFKQFYVTDALLDAGLEVITASANRSCNDMMGVPDHQSHLPNCFISARKGMIEGKGNLVTSWAVRHNHPELGHPATFAASYSLLHKEEFNPQVIYDEFTRDFYGVALPEFYPATVLVQTRFRFAESRGVNEALKKLEEKEDPKNFILEYYTKQFKDKNGAINFFNSVIKECNDAYIMFEAMKLKATKNAHNIDFWLEGIALQKFYAEFILLVFEEKLVENSMPLLNRLNGLRENSVKLFSETYMPIGVKDEVEQRYGFFLKYLNSDFIKNRSGVLKNIKYELPQPIAHWPLKGSTQEIVKKRNSLIANKITFVGGPDGSANGAASFDGRESFIQVTDDNAFHFK